MGIENMDFGRAHHSGMPTAEPEVGVTKPTAETIITKPGVPNRGVFDNFGRPNMYPEAYMRRLARAEEAWNRRME